MCVYTTITINELATVLLLYGAVCVVRSCRAHVVLEGVLKGRN